MNIYGKWQCDKLRDAVGSLLEQQPPILRLGRPPATMDRLESLSNTIQNITLYDIKSMYNQVCPLTCFMFPRKLLTILTHQAKNVVLNISEMEAKVREATNEDPWCVKSLCYQESRLKPLCRGASSTLMQEIAQGYVPLVISEINVLTSF